MKKRNYIATITLTVTLCLTYLLSGCTRDNDIDIPQTSVNMMEATTVQPGEAITLTGENMHLISKVYFGNDITIDIKTPQTDRDHQSLTVYVPTEVFEETKVVPLAVLYNSVHHLVVCEELTVYSAPVIPTTSTTLSGEVEPGDIITITGTDLNIVTTLQANEESITMESKNATEITFKAPEVNMDTEFTITLIYDNSLGNDQKLVVPGKITVKKVIPPSENAYYQK
ncbi:IPT/TIG domain-containing protein [uncultured Bacteroides sp.]|uniref:IPT/TIG domain-containing protein n=1 Tax=uncultured Bacteroides sp. TaxID=162156 RepID=UPI000822D6C5|nr:IPT/TIG domain-containing protein [uncultured Bacteroides sp.]SCH43355.1 IPT/TIG domain [uncultured Bacteroides sp.]